MHEDGAICAGDSGSPSLLDDTDVVGSITIGGPAGCKNVNWAMRIDTPQARAFLGTYVTLPSICSRIGRAWRISAYPRTTGAGPERQLPNCSNHISFRSIAVVGGPQLSGCNGSGPGVEPHAPNGYLTSLTGHGKVEVGGLEPAIRIGEVRRRAGALELAVCRIAARGEARRDGHELDSISAPQRPRPYRYLKNVLERLPTQPASRIGELLPHSWTPATPS